MKKETKDLLDTILSDAAEAYAEIEANPQALTELRCDRRDIKTNSAAYSETFEKAKASASIKLKNVSYSG